METLSKDPEFMGSLIFHAFTFPFTQLNNNNRTIQETETSDCAGRGFWEDHSDLIRIHSLTL